MGTVGKNLKRLREAKNLSIRGLAKLIGISHNTLASYEREDFTPSIITGNKLAQFFNVPIEYFVIGEKSIAQFNDSRLLELFKEVDVLGKQERDIVKKFILKVIKNRKEWKQITEEAEEGRKKENPKAEKS